MARKKSTQKRKSIIFTTILAVLVIAVFAYLIINEGSIMPKKEKVAALVNGEKITEDEVDLEYSKLPPAYKSFISKDEILQQIIDKTLLMQEAESMGIKVSESEISQELDSIKLQFPTEEVFNEILKQQNLTLDEIKNQIKEQIIINKLLNQSVFSGISISDEEISKYYGDNKVDFTAQQGQIRAAHILVESESKAEQIISQLKMGADFEELALKESKDSSVAINKGDLGFFSKGTMVKEFEDAAFSLKVGAISAPVETQFGYHIIKRLPNKITLNEAKDSIVASILRSKQADAIEEYIKGLKDKADIQIMGEEIKPRSTPKIETEYLFGETEDELCTEDGIPIIRFYTSSTCRNCQLIKPAFENAVADYDVKVMEWEIDTGDDLYTGAIEGAIPKSEYEILKKYNPKAAVPSFVFGCRFVRVGASSTDLEKEEEIFRKQLDELT